MSFSEMKGEEGGKRGLKPILIEIQNNNRNKFNEINLKYNNPFL